MIVIILLSLTLGNLIILTTIHIYSNRCLKELLDFDASITKADKDGNDALHIACIHGQLHIVQFLLQRGLSAELRCVCILECLTVTR